jgi:hypothetical protein
MQSRAGHVRDRDDASGDESRRAGCAGSEGVQNHEQWVLAMLCGASEMRAWRKDLLRRHGHEQGRRACLHPRHLRHLRQGLHRWTVDRTPDAPRLLGAVAAMQRRWTADGGRRGPLQTSRRAASRRAASRRAASSVQACSAGSQSADWGRRRRCRASRELAVTARSHGRRGAQWSQPTSLPACQPTCVPAHVRASLRAYPRPPRPRPPTCYPTTYAHAGASASASSSNAWASLSEELRAARCGGAQTPAEHALLHPARTSTSTCTPSTCTSTSMAYPLPHPHPLPLPLPLPTHIPSYPLPRLGAL